MTEKSRDSLEMALVHLRDASIRVVHDGSAVEQSILHSVIGQVKGLMDDEWAKKKKERETKGV